VSKARRAATRRGRRLRIMFADEARFGRMNRPRPCWAPIGIRPEVASQLVREYVYLYGAVSPKDGTCVFLVMPAPDTECFRIFLNTVAKKYSRDLILLVVDANPWTKSMTNLMRQRSTSNATQGSSNQSLRSPTLPSHSDMEMV
jgi:hypothetical protein